MGTFRDCIRIDVRESGVCDGEDVETGAKRGRPSSSICIEVSSSEGCSGSVVVITSKSTFSSAVEGGRGISWTFCTSSAKDSGARCSAVGAGIFLLS